jgi:hypothetical protein
MTGKSKVVDTHIVINNIPYGPKSVNSIAMAMVLTTHEFINIT